MTTTTLNIMATIIFFLLAVMLPIVSIYKDNKYQNPNATLINVTMRTIKQFTLNYVGMLILSLAFAVYMIFIVNNIDIILRVVGILALIGIGIFYYKLNN